MKDFLNEDIDGHFYEKELQAVTKDIQSVYKIEQVLKTKKKTRCYRIICQVVRVAKEVQQLDKGQ